MSAPLKRARGIRTSSTSSAHSSPEAKRVHHNTEMALVNMMNRTLGQPVIKVKRSRQTQMVIDPKLTSRQADFVAALKKKEEADAAVKAARQALAAKVAQIKAQRKVLRGEEVPDLSDAFAKWKMGGGKRRN
jgi:hypothetical protein